MPREKQADKIRRAGRIESKLFAYYGPGIASLNYYDPFSLLVAVVLSAQCTDAAVNKATPALMKAYPDCYTMAKASVDDIAHYIKTLGFYRAKATHLQALAQKLVSNFDGIVPADINLLQSLDGVGRKTANVVMCEAFKLPSGIAVDTHVFRIAHRLKLVGPCATSPEKVEKALLKLFLKHDWIYINHQLVHFGREFCSARNPRCVQCILREECPSCMQK